MGILNKTRKQYVSKQEVTGKMVADMLSEKLGDAYKVKLKEKGGIGKQMIGIAGQDDSVSVIKNAYHRATITVSEYKSPEGVKEYYFYFDNSQISPFLRILSREIGWIGMMIVGAIYGKADEFYDDIFKHIQKEFNAETREVEVGLNALLGKKKKEA